MILNEEFIAFSELSPESAGQTRATETKEVIWDADVEMCLVPQVLYEFWVTASRPEGSPNGLGMTLPQVQQSIEELLQGYTLTENFQLDI